MTENQEGHSDEQRRAVSKPEIDAVLGPVIGEFVLRAVVDTGRYPQEVKEVWPGLPLPIRRNFYSNATNQVHVYFVDCYNAMEASRTPPPVLRIWGEYWLDNWGDGDETCVGTTFPLDASQGDIHFYPTEEQLQYIAESFQPNGIEDNYTDKK